MGDTAVLKKNPGVPSGIRVDHLKKWLEEARKAWAVEAKAKAPKEVEEVTGGPGGE